MKAKGKIKIEREYCKACGYCLEFCPKHVIALAKVYNLAGYYPAEQVSEDCTGCGICGLVCPEACIEVFLEQS